MTHYEKQLDRLLSTVADNVDLKHCGEVDERYRRALCYQDVDRPPLVVQPPYGEVFDLPPPWDEFLRYPYRDTFSSPAAMLQNAILNSVIPGILLKDDSPLAIRNNHGTIQIASVLGAEWKLHEDNYPWVERFDSLDQLEAIAFSDEAISEDAGMLKQSFKTLSFYGRKLAEYPPCNNTVQISIPDLQGPMDTAEQMWGSGIYYAFHYNPELLRKLLSRIVDVTTDVYERFRKYSRDSLDPTASTQHGYVIPGRLLIRNDSSIMLSPDTYSEFVRPYDSELLATVGSGSIHFCGDGQHLVDGMLKIERLRGLDFGEAHLLDVAAIYDKCRGRRVAVTRIKPSREDLAYGRAKKSYPTGAVFVYVAHSIDEAIQVVRAYQAD